MAFFCRHCDEVATGAMYRVFSEEQGITLLDMIVCRLCYEQAKELGLDGEEIGLDENSRQQLLVDSSFVDKSIRTR
jgi:superfamily II helicase